MNREEERLYVSANFLAVRWSMNLSTVRRKLQGAGLEIKMGSGKRAAVRYLIEDVVRLEESWRKG